MININLTEREIEVLNKSINHCLETCKKRGKGNCEDCDTLKEVQRKLV